MSRAFTVQGKPRIDCRGDTFHFHLTDGGTDELDLVLDLEPLWEFQSALKAALAAYIEETQKARRGEAPEFERIMHLAPADSLRAH